jgi:hypothetical protein
VTLSSEDWLRLVTWVDGNAPYHSHFINMRPDQPPYNLPADRELLGAIEAVHARRCASCHKAQEVTRADWIDLCRPERSLFLAAPLAKTGAGRKCAQPPYADAADADYQAVLKLVDQAVKKAWSAPRRDLLGLLPEAPRVPPQAITAGLAR